MAVSRLNSIIMVLVLGIFLVSSDYKGIPKEYNLTNIIILLRHGDRVQITKDLSDSFPSEINLTKFWKSKLPTESTLRHISKSDPHISTNVSYKALKKELYSGWDFINFPYGQLTERGIQQLRRIGRKFWKRYSNFILYGQHYIPKAERDQMDVNSQFMSNRESLYFRSTNMCRTLLSLRAFLNGFFHNMTIAYPDTYKKKSVVSKRRKPLLSWNALTSSFFNVSTFASSLNRGQTLVNSNNYSNSKSSNTNINSSGSGINSSVANTTGPERIIFNQIFSPIIVARPRLYETMFPGICEYLALRRTELIRLRYNNATSVPAYALELELKLNASLNLPMPFSWLTWLNIMEILHCYSTYQVPLPGGLTARDSELTEAYVTWQWGNLYRDSDMVRYAMGRYFKELYDDIRLSVEDVPLPEWRRSSYFYYVRRQKYRKYAPKGESNTHIVSDKDYSPTATAAIAERSKKEEDESFVRVLSPPPVQLPSGRTKFAVYSGHDATMVPLLVILGIYNDSWPDYASQVTLEFVTASHPYIPVSNATDTSAGSRTSARSKKNSRFKQIFDRIKQKIQSNFNIRSRSSVKNPVNNNYRYVRVVYNDQPQEIEMCAYAYSLQQQSNLSSFRQQQKAADSSNSGYSRYWCPYEVFLEILKINMIRHKDYEIGCNKKS